MWKFPIPQKSAASIAILFYAGDLEPRAKEKENRCTVKIIAVLDKDFGSNFEGNQSFFSETYNFSQIQIKTHFFKNPHKIVLSQ